MGNKQRLFEVMKKVNSDFKPNLNENIDNKKNFRLTEGIGKTKTFTLNLWGQDETLYFNLNQYDNNGALAVELMSPTEGPYAMVSVNLPESAELPKDEFFMKNWSENQELAEQLIEKGIVQPTGKQASSGFVTAESYKLNPIYGSIGNISLNEDRGDFKRMKVYLIYGKDGDFLGELDPIDDETSMYFDNIDDVVATPEFEKFAQEKNIGREQVGRVKTESMYSMNGNPLDKEYYSPSQSEELFDPKTNTWYNLSGHQMRDPSEYERYSDGTNQWGERYDDDY
jgi:hypothetical protein